MASTSLYPLKTINSDDAERFRFRTVCLCLYLSLVSENRSYGTLVQEEAARTPCFILPAKPSDSSSQVAKEKKKKISYLFKKKNFNSALAKLLLVSVIIIGNKAAPPKHDFQSQSRLSVQKYIQHIFFKFSSSCIYPAFLACFFFLCFLFGSCHCLFILQSSFTPVMTATYEMLKKHFSTIFLFLFTARVYMCVRVSFDS